MSYGLEANLKSNNYIFHHIPHHIKKVFYTIDGPKRSVKYMHSRAVNHTESLSLGTNVYPNGNHFSRRFRNIENLYAKIIAEKSIKIKDVKLNIEFGGFYIDEERIVKTILINRSKSLTIGFRIQKILCREIIKMPVDSDHGIKIKQCHHYSLHIFISLSKQFIYTLRKLNKLRGEEGVNYYLQDEHWITP